MNIALVGYGRMNRMTAELIEARQDLQVVGVVDAGMLASLEDVQAPVDAVIDFSHADNLPGTLAYARAHGVAAVIGTTGLTDTHLAAIREAALYAPILYTANFSLGVTVLKRAVAMVAQALGDDYDIEIVEAHHRNKADAPSGTALLLADAADPIQARPRVCGRAGIGARGAEIGISSVRGGTVAGEHRVLFLGGDETIELRHEAASRRVFAQGALRAAKRLAGAKPGLYTMENILWGDLA